MGGSGSGRCGRYVSIEGTQSYVLSVRHFNLARLPRGIRGKAEYPFKDGFSVDIKTYTGDSPEMLVSHYTNDGRDNLIEYAIPLLWTVPPYGGLRWWFLCPATHRRCCKLYLPNGGRRFLSRKAYRLRYASQVETRLARLQRQCRKLNRALGGDGEHDWIPDRPRGMWLRTYERLAGKLDHYIGDAEAEWSRGAMAFLVRSGLWPNK